MDCGNLSASSEEMLLGGYSQQLLRQEAAVSSHVIALFSSQVTLEHNQVRPRDIVEYYRSSNGLIIDILFHN